MHTQLGKDEGDDEDDDDDDDDDDANDNNDYDGGVDGYNDKIMYFAAQTLYKTLLKQGRESNQGRLLSMAK